MAQVAIEASPADTAVEVQEAQVAQEAQDAREQGLDDEMKVTVVTIQDLPLSDEQESRIAAIRKEFRPKVQGASKELETLAAAQIDKIRNILTPEQRQKVRAMLAERAVFRVENLAHGIANLEELDLTEEELMKISEISDEYRPRMAKARKQLQGLLTDEQKKAREEAITAGKSRSEILAALNLSSDQKAKLDGVAKELKDLVSEEVDKIRGVLTASQRETLQEQRAERAEVIRDRLAHRIANLKDLNLTDEQKTSLMNIRQEYRPKLQNAGNRLRTSVGEEVRRIVGVLKPERADVAERVRVVE
jgi:Spy/CpxP family protein refolding chaperone